MARGKRGIEESIVIIKRIKILLFLLIALFAFGTIFFMLAGNSFFKAFIKTIEVLAFAAEPQIGFAKAIQIFLSIFGSFVLWWVLWTAADFAFGGELSKYLKELSSLKKVGKMKEHYIICGGGTTGSEIAKSLTEKNIPFMIIEKDEKEAEKLKKKNFIVFVGDAIEEEILVEGGIKDAKILITTLPETEKNIMIVLAAKDLNSNVKVYARAEKKGFIGKLKKAGADQVFIPQITCAEKIISEISEKEKTDKAEKERARPEDKKTEKQEEKESKEKTEKKEDKKEEKIEEKKPEEKK